MLSICILLSTVFCSVAVCLVTVYTIASYILSVHVRCINLYVYNIIFTAKKSPRKTAFYLFREANIFFYLHKTGAKSLPELFTPVHFFKYSNDRFYFYRGVTALPDTIFTVPLYTAPGYPPERVFRGFTAMFPLFMASSVICAKYSSVTPASVDTPHS